MPAVCFPGLRLNNPPPIVESGWAWKIGRAKFVESDCICIGIDIPLHAYYLIMLGLFGWESLRSIGGTFPLIWVVARLQRNREKKWHWCLRERVGGLASTARTVYQRPSPFFSIQSSGRN